MEISEKKDEEEWKYEILKVWTQFRGLSKELQDSYQLGYWLYFCSHPEGGHEIHKTIWEVQTLGACVES